MPAESYDLKVIANDQVYTSIALEDLTQWINEGRVAPRDFVRAAGQDQWIPVTSVPEFADLLSVFGAPSPESSPEETSPQAIPTAPKATTSPKVSNEAPLATPLATPVAAGETSQSRSWTYDATIYDLADGQDPADLDEEIGASTGAWPKYEIEEGQMDMLPMIDVIFQLLIFFMFTTTAANPAPIEAPESVTGVGINEAGIQMVLIDKEHRLYLGDRAVEENRRDTIETLVAEVERNANELGGNLPVVINAHKEARHGVVMDLHKMLVKLPNIGNVKYGVEEKQ